MHVNLYRDKDLDSMYVEGVMSVSVEEFQT